MKRSYKKLAHDLYWGRRLQLAWCYTTANGFRGKAKGQGFAAWLKKQNIPRRTAYRQMALYEKIVGMVFHAKIGNEEFQVQLEKEYGNPLARWGLENFQGRAIRAADRDTNEQAIREQLAEWQKHFPPGKFKELYQQAGWTEEEVQRYLPHS